jgi:predicted RNA-binding Zn ribbon-like protein
MAQSAAQPTPQHPAGRVPAPEEFRPLQEFVNTLDLLAGEDELQSPEALAGWLIDHGFAGRGTGVTNADLAYAIRVREAVRLFLSRDRGRPSESEVSLLDEAGRRARLQWSFDTEGGISLVARAPGVMGAIGTLLAPLLSAATTGELQRLKTCRNCRWVFYDYSKNRSGTWCSMAICGSRMKARRHYWRSRDGGVGSESSRSAP